MRHRRPRAVGVAAIALAFLASAASITVHSFVAYRRRRTT